MNKKYNGCVGLACRKDIECFVRAITIGDVERAFQGSTRVSRSLRPICKMRCMVWHQGAVVVHAVVPSCTVGFHGHRPLNFHFQSHLDILPIARVGVGRFCEAIANVSCAREVLTRREIANRHAQSRGG